LKAGCEPVATSGPLLSAHNKVVVVTGAARGIGHGFARSLAAAGATIVAADISDCSATLERIGARGGQAISRRSDVLVEGETRAVAASAQEGFGRFDILVSGAVPNDPSGTVLETSVADWNRLAVNLTGSFLLSRAVLPLMIPGVAARSPSSLRNSDASAAAGELLTALPRAR
jgi:NAD(P)-dependent dehydrogenase (short-subunit alcohol dehydrogenase family)